MRAGALLFVLAVGLGDLSTTRQLARADQTLVGTRLLPEVFAGPQGYWVAVALWLVLVAIVIARREGSGVEASIALCVLIGVALHLTIVLGHFGL